MKRLTALSLSALSFSALAIPAHAAESLNMSGVTTPIEDLGFTMISVPSDGIEKSMPAGDNSNGIPERIQGLFWMDGNPLGDILLSFAGATWDQETRVAVLPVAGPRVFSFFPTDKGRQAFKDALDSQLTYELHFNEDYSFAQILPISTFMLRANNRTPKELLSFTMTWISEGHYSRDNTFGSVFWFPGYQLRRIVRPDGTREAAYADYLKFAQPESLLGVHK